MEDLKVTIIQFDIIWEDKLANFKKLEADYLAKLNVNETDLIVLPEMFATGFTMRPTDFYELEDGLTFQWLKKWSSKLNSAIAAGLITVNSEGKFHNTFVFVQPDGSVEAYHKRHLFRMGEENNHYQSGILPKIVNVKDWKINLQICYDLRFPVFARNNSSDGQVLYDAIIYIANWPEARTYAWTNLLQARSIENQAYVVGVNRIGLDGNSMMHSGESAIIDPTGNHILKPIVGKEKMLKTVLNFEVLEKGRSVFPVLSDADRFKITD